MNHSPHAPSAPVPVPMPPPPYRPHPQKRRGVLTFIIGSCVGMALLSGGIVASCCLGAAYLSNQEAVVYHASAGRCRVDVKYLDVSGNSQRGVRTPRGSGEAGEERVANVKTSIRSGGVFKVSVIPAESCMAPPVCWVTFGDKVLVPRTVGRRKSPAVCSGSVPES